MGDPSTVLCFAGDFEQCGRCVSRWRGRRAAMHLAAPRRAWKRTSPHTGLSAELAQYNCASLQLLVLRQGVWQPSQSRTVVMRNASGFTNLPEARIFVPPSTTPHWAPPNRPAADIGPEPF